MSNENDSKHPERVWITWDDAYPWPTPESSGDEYVRADLLTTARKEARAEAFTAMGVELRRFGANIRKVDLLARFQEMFREDDAAAASPAAPADAAWNVAVEVANDRLGPRSDGPQFWDKYAAYVKGVVERYFPAPAAPQEDALVDEVQHRMDQVVDAAVEWHQSGREGGEWFEAAEKLGAAINSLLELRSDPKSVNECFCGTELEAGLCPNGHDPVNTAATPTPSLPARDAAREIAQYLDAFTSLSPSAEMIRIFENTITRHLPAAAETVRERDDKENSTDAT